MMSVTAAPTRPLCIGPGDPSPDGSRPRRTQVHFTIDVECSVGGAYNGPDRLPRGYDLRVWCRLANQPRPWGIEFIMDELERHGLAGTFFVEAFAARYFGKPGLAEVCGAIRDRGHDVQLHLHPGMLNLIPGADRQVNRLNDNFFAHDLKAQVELLERGLGILADCGVESPVAFRAGGFAADTNTWAALGKVGLRISSNYNLAYLAGADGSGVRRSRLARWFSPWAPAGTCRLPALRPHNDLFAVPQAEGLLELPVTCIRTLGADGRMQYRHLAVPALSTAEMIHALRQARVRGLAHVTLILHSFDFVRLDDARAGTGRPIAAHVRRFRRICQWLANHADTFEVTPVAQMVGAEAAHRTTTFGAGPPECGDPVLQGSLLLGGLRQAEQLCTRLRYR